MFLGRVTAAERPIVNGNRRNHSLIGDPVEASDLRPPLRSIIAASARSCWGRPKKSGIPLDEPRRARPTASSRSMSSMDGANPSPPAKRMLVF